MPAALLRLIPLLLGFGADFGAKKLLTGGATALAGKAPGLSKFLGHKGTQIGGGLGAFFGAEHLASSALGLNDQAEQISGNASNLTDLGGNLPTGVSQNQQSLQALQQDEMLRTLINSGGVF